MRVKATLMYWQIVVEKADILLLAITIMIPVRTAWQKFLVCLA